jgi:hypothetical protein
MGAAVDIDQLRVLWRQAKAKEPRQLALLLQRVAVYAGR